MAATFTSLDRRPTALDVASVLARTERGEFGPGARRRLAADRRRYLLGSVAIAVTAVALGAVFAFSGEEDGPGFGVGLAFAAIGVVAAVVLFGRLVRHDDRRWTRFVGFADDNRFTPRLEVGIGELDLPGWLDVGARRALDVVTWTWAEVPFTVAKLRRGGDRFNTDWRFLVARCGDRLPEFAYLRRGDTSRHFPGTTDGWERLDHAGRAKLWAPPGGTGAVRALVTDDLAQLLDRIRFGTRPPVRAFHDTSVVLPSKSIHGSSAWVADGWFVVPLGRDDADDWRQAMTIARWVVDRVSQPTPSGRD